MLKFFKRAHEDADAKIVELQTKMEESKKRIRLLRTEMKSLEEQGLNADDLDMKILSLDYEAKKGEMDSEMARFQDMSMMISKLQDKQKLDEKRKHLDTLTQVTDDMDLGKVMRDADELTIRRDMLDEEYEAYEAARASWAASDVTLEPGSEFSSRVAELRVKKRHDEVMKGEIVPAGEALAKAAP